MGELLILGIETSGPRGGVALVRINPDDDSYTKIGETILEAGMRHGQELAPAVEKLLAEANVAPKDLTLAACGTGPGSYTGTRIGIAFTKGLAFAAGIPAIGTPSLDAMAHALAEEDTFTDGHLLAAVDAHRKQIYWSLYRRDGINIIRKGPIWLTGPEEVGEGLDDVEAFQAAGSALTGYPELLGGSGKATDEAGWFAPPRWVAVLGWKAYSSNDTDNAFDIEPLYLRESVY